MKLFLRDHTQLILFYFYQMISIGTLCYLCVEDKSMHIVLYGALLSVVLFIVGMVLRYVRLRQLYAFLQTPMALVKAPLQPLGSAPLPSAVHRLLHEVERDHRSTINHARSRLDDQAMFMNRWVHQMKTPLSVVQLITQDIDDPQVECIQYEIDRLRKGMETVLHASRLDRFEDDFQVAYLSLKEVVSESIADNRRLFIRKGVFPVIDIDESIGVYSDRKWLHFMLMQLLTNAVNYSDRAGAKVNIGAYEQDKQIILDIQDEGIGISSHDIQRVFNPYFTGDRGRQYHESTGIGLYLVKEISARLGNRVKIFSTVGEGTLVKLIWSKGSEYVS